MARMATRSGWCAALWLALVVALVTARVDAQATTFDPAARQERAAELAEHGARLVQRGDPGSAVWYLREALRVDAGFAPAAVALANIYLARNEAAAARQVIVDVLEHAPGHAALWLALHRALLALGDVQGGADALREGLRFSPNDVVLLQAAMELSLQGGEWLRALSLQRALSETSTHGAPQASDVDAALRVLVGSTDRARGLRCEAHLSVVRQALAGCTTYAGQTRQSSPAALPSASPSIAPPSSPVSTTRN